MKRKAEPKQVAILVCIVCLGAYFHFTSGPDIPPEAKGQPSKRAVTTAFPSCAQATRANRTNASLQDFKPSLKVPKEGLNAASTDPGLQSDSLARVQAVNYGAGTRSLFDFGQLPQTKKKQGSQTEAKRHRDREIGTIVDHFASPAPTDAATVGSTKTPIPLKYYGFRGNLQHASKRGFFLDGDDIRLASEGELISKRYRVIKIGLTSAVLEDTQQSYIQTLPLEEGQLGS